MIKFSLKLLHLSSLVPSQKAHLKKLISKLAYTFRLHRISVSNITTKQSEQDGLKGVFYISMIRELNIQQTARYQIPYQQKPTLPGLKVLSTP